MAYNYHHHHQREGGRVSDRGTVFRLMAQFCSPSTPNSQSVHLWCEFILTEKGETLKFVFGHFESRNLSADKVQSPRALPYEEQL